MNKSYEEYIRVGYTFVPIQEFNELYTPEEALTIGTAFPELNLPISVYGQKTN